MTGPQILSLVLLGVCLVLAIWRKVNIGIAALAAAAIVLAVHGGDATKLLYPSFPGNLFALIAGVSLMFAHLERSGAIQAFVGAVFKAIGKRTVLLPWAAFIIAAAMSTMGAFSTAPIALLVPVVAYVSAESATTFLITELGVIIGANSAGLSPLNPTGAVVHTALTKTHTAYNEWGVWLISICTAVVAMIVLQIIDAFLRRRNPNYAATPAPQATSTDPNAPSAAKTPAYAITSGISLLVFVVVVIWLKWDIGVTSMLIAVVLLVIFRPSQKELIKKVPWNAILLLCGLLTYLGLIQAIGTMDGVQAGLKGIGSRAILVLVLAYVTAALCNIESSTIGVLGLIMPVVGTTLGTQPAITWIVAAVAAPAALTVMNPIHVAGTLIIANSHEQQQSKLFNRLLVISVGLTCVMPGILALIAMPQIH